MRYSDIEAEQETRMNVSSGFHNYELGSVRAYSVRTVAKLCSLSLPSRLQARIPQFYTAKLDGSYPDREQSSCDFPDFEPALG